MTECPIETPVVAGLLSPPSFPPYQGRVDVAGVGDVAVDGEEGGPLADLGQHGVGSVHRLVQAQDVVGAGLGREGEGGRGGRNGSEGRGG